MKLSVHTHPRYIVWLKYFAFVSVIILLLDLIYIDFVKYPHSTSVASDVLNILIVILSYSIVMLISVYFFGQNITIVDEGLLIEFLWKDLMVSWDKIVEIKPVFGVRKTYVVLTTALTPFHRCFGLLYGFSAKPGFIIYLTISEQKSLIETIKKHIKKS